MSFVKLSRLANSDQARLYDFLAKYNHDIAAKALGTILDAIDTLEQFPFKGTPVEDRPNVRRFVVDFGASGYLVFHKYNEKTDTVQIARILHQLELYEPKTIGVDAETSEGWR